jgi:hypothetical protein
VAGYSGTPLAAKLGIKSGTTLALVNAPPDLDLTLPETVTVLGENYQRSDVVLAFFSSAGELDAQVDALGAVVFPSGSLWLAWPKKAARIGTDLSDQVVRTCALARGLVDNKVCAIDATWSGLRVVWRKELRSVPPSAPSALA